MYSSNIVIKMTAAYIFLGLVLALFVGCGDEIEVPFIIDQDEIARYIRETEEGRELFRVSGLVPGDDYVLDFDSGATYRDVLDSTRRSLHFDMILPEHIDTLKQDFGSPLGWARDAEVSVEDRLFVTTFRTEGDTTTQILRDRTLRRYAYFLKLGDDLRSYAGWLLHGYNGNRPLTPSGMSIRKADNSTFAGDGRDYRTFRSLVVNVASSPWDTVETRITSRGYIKLVDIANIAKGERLIATGSDISNSSIYQTMTGETNAGFVSGAMYQPDPSSYLDTIVTPPANKRLWNILFFEEFRTGAADSSGLIDLSKAINGSWCVPFRVAQ